MSAYLSVGRGAVVASAHNGFRPEIQKINEFFEINIYNQEKNNISHFLLSKLELKTLKSRLERAIDSEPEIKGSEHMWSPESYTKNEKDKLQNASVIITVNNNNATVTPIDARLLLKTITSVLNIS